MAKNSKSKPATEEQQPPEVENKEEQQPPEVENKEEEAVQEEPKEQPIEESTQTLDVEAMSDLELASMQEKINAQKITNHLEAEKQRIEDTSCPSCGQTLGLKGEDYLKTDNLPQRIECPNCEMLSAVYVNYSNDPSIADANITVKPQGYVWETQAPSTWSDDHAKRWAQEESVKLAEGRSTLINLENQKLFRVMQLILKKQKLIK